MLRISVCTCKQRGAYEFKALENDVYKNVCIDTDERGDYDYPSSIMHE